MAAESIRDELGPAITVHPDRKGSAVHCTYVRNSKPGKVPRKLLNLSMVSELLDDFLAVDCYPTWGSQRNISPVCVEYDEFGKPCLKAGEFTGMTVSFSSVADMLWASLSGPGNHLGMDVASPAEFDGGYPFHRSFQLEELCLSIGNVRGLHESAAMLWSVKEAAVKALGTGFGLLGPLDIRIEFIEDCATYYIPRISIAPAPLRRIGLDSLPHFSMISFCHAGAWVSVAVRPRIHCRGGEIAEENVKLAFRTQEKEIKFSAGSAFQL